MLDPSYQTPKQEKSDFPLIPEGIYQVVIEDINEKIVPKYKVPDETESKLNFQFVILDDGDFKGQRLFKLIRPVVFSGNKNNRPSFLYQLWKAAMRTEPTEVQVEAGLSANDLNGLIGKQLTVMVKVSAPNPNGKQFSNVEGITSVKKELPVPALKSKAPNKPEAPVATSDEESLFDTEEEQKIKESDLPF